LCCGDCAGEKQGKKAEDTNRSGPDPLQFGVQFH
jgi:hypothetical protein